MKNRLFRAACGLALGAAAIVGCREGTAPSSLAAMAQPRASLSSRSTRHGVLVRTSPLRGVRSATAIIGAAGGTLRLDEAGLTLTVPAGAVANDVEFSVSARGGHLVAYEFEPHGTTFAVPLTLTQDLGATRAANDAAVMQSLFGGYVAPSDAMDVANATAEVSELLPVSIDESRQSVSFPVAHFSGYILATGKTDTTKTPARTSTTTTTTTTTSSKR